MTANDRIRLVAASAHPIWLRGFVDLAPSIERVEVTGYAEDAPALKELLERVAVDVLVIDADLIPLLRALLRPDHDIPRVLVVGRPRHAGTRPSFGRSCACGYISERAPISIVTQLVDLVARCPLPHAGLAACAGCSAPRTFAPPALPLSEREREIFVRIGWGLGPSEIAAELDIHVKTIETHRESIKRKLGLSSATELLDAAFKWRDGEPLPRSWRDVDSEPT